MVDSESHSGERVLLYILVGIGIFGLAYLFFKDQFRKQDTIQTGSGSLGLGIGGRTTSLLALNNPRIDELERQTVELENVLNEKLKLYDYRLNQLDISNQWNNQLGKLDNKGSQTETSKLYQLSGLRPSRAGSVATVKTSVEDKVRQQDFGMI